MDPKRAKRLIANRQACCHAQRDFLHRAHTHGIVPVMRNLCKLHMLPELSMPL